MTTPKRIDMTTPKRIDMTHAELRRRINGVVRAEQLYPEVWGANLKIGQSYQSNYAALRFADEDASEVRRAIFDAIVKDGE